MKLKFVLHRLLVGFACLMLVYTAVYFAREASKYEAWSTAGRIETRFEIRSDSLMVFVWFDESCHAGGRLPQAGDTLIALDDSLTTLASVQAYIDRPEPPGREMRFRARGHEGEYIAGAVSVVPSFGERVSFAVLILLRLLTAVAFIVIGIRAALLRPDSPGVRALLLFNLSMAAFVTVNVYIFNASYAAFDYPGRAQIQQALNVLGLLFSAFWLHLLLLFPRKPHSVKGRHWPLYVLCYLPHLLLQVAVRVFPAYQQALVIGIFSLMALQVVAGLLRLQWCVRHAANPLERRQGSIVLMGSGIGQVLLVALILGLNVLSRWTQDWSEGLTLWLINLVFLAVLLGPLSTVWAFGRYRLLEVEVRVRRTTRVVLMSGLLMGMLALLAYGAVLVLIRARQIEDLDTVVALATLAGIAVLPIHLKLIRLLRERLLPERKRMETMVREFLERMVSMPDRTALWSHLAERLGQELTTTVVLPLLSEEGEEFLLATGEPSPFRNGGPLAELLGGLGSPLPLDELLAGGRIDLDERQIAWLRERQVALLLPLRAGRADVGILALGARRNGEDYGADELQALGTLAAQVALASENLRLLEENLEKRRLDEQLAMARDIQQRFLPQNLPKTPGLEVVARSLFCLEVAGDYYDVIPLADGRTVLAVGDVSGKGAGAAMLMANLQASLRTGLRVGDRLEETVADINRLICGNTSDEQFITFFAGVYDPVSGIMEYVNAGHNPPVVIHADGASETLETGGLLLGVLETAHYERGRSQLRGGDLLLLYTDGVSEALDPGEEEFGEQRMLDAVRAHAVEDLDSLLDGIEREVVRFQGREGFDDDFTLLIGRVVSTTG